jgi:predicted RNA binding protein YcfA (HicA-like mRNA interferase family)
MKSVSGRKFARILERHGWSLLRVQGSHHIYGRPGTVVRLSVPIHAEQPLKIGLLHHLLKAAGLTETDLDI